MDKYNRRFMCPTCGRAPAIPNFDWLTPNMRTWKLRQRDEALAKTGGFLADGSYECLNEHRWHVPAIVAPSNLDLED